MGINIDLAKIYKIIRDSGKTGTDEVIRCLEMIAWESEELCTIWEKIITLSVKKDKIKKSEKNKLLNTNLFSDSSPLYGRLINFYRNISAALVGKPDFDWVEKIYNHVAQIILYQKDIKEILDDFNKIKWSPSPLYLSSENNSKVIKDLATSLQTLQNEVVTLKTLPELMKREKIDDSI